MFLKKIKELDKRDLFMWILFSPNKCIYDRKCLRPVFPRRWAFSSSDFRMRSPGKKPGGERPCAVIIMNSSLAVWLSWLSIASYTEGLGVQFSGSMCKSADGWFSLPLSIHLLHFISLISLLCKCSPSLCLCKKWNK